MRGAETLIPARFLTLIGHLCVLVTLIWESQQSVQHCLPSQYHQNYFETYHSRLVAAYAASIVLVLIELTTFILGLTMFSSTVSLISIGCHGAACAALTYGVLGGWHCSWVWPVLAFGAALPAGADMPTNEHQQLTGSGKYKGGWSFYLVLAGVATTLGCSLPVGYNISVINTPASIIQHFVNESVTSHYHVAVTKNWMNVLWSSVVAIFIVGGCAGSILGAALADKHGRRKATLLTSVISVTGAILFLVCQAANSVELLILGRLIVGLSAGLTTSIVPMYLSELAPMALAGAMGVVCPMGVNVGVLVGQVMGLDCFLGGANNWPYLLAAYAVLVIICIPLIFILPESPKYLYVVKREEETALKELSRLRAVSPSILTEDLELLKDEVRAAAEATDQKWSLRRVLREPRLRLVLLLTCSVQAGQQTSGINAVFYYSDIIFRGAGLTRLGSQYATIGCGAINVCTALLMIHLLPRFGRRPLLLGSILAAAICLAALAVSIRFLDAVAGMPYVCMAAVFAYVLAYGFGLGPIPYFIASEMFEVPPRGAGMAWGSLANWGGNFLIGITFPALREAIGPYSFIIFATVTLGLFVFQRDFLPRIPISLVTFVRLYLLVLRRFYFPETRGKTPLQISQLCSRGFRSRPLVRLNDV